MFNISKLINAFFNWRKRYINWPTDESFLLRLLGHSSINNEKKQVIKKSSPVLDHSINTIDKIVSFICHRNKDNSNELINYIWGPVVVGIIIMALFFGIFGIWSATAPLDGAVIAMGEVVSSSNRQIVQHLEGGIINEILIKEGDIVQKDQPLIYLNNTTAKANLSILEEKITMLMLTEARLLAMKEKQDNIILPVDLTKSLNKEMLNKTIESQERILNSHKKTISGQINIINQRIQQLHQEINGLKIQLESANKQYNIINDELIVKKKLLKDGYISKPYIMSLEKQHAESKGRIGQYESLIAQTKQKIAENKLEIINIDNNVQDKINLELKETHATIADLKERLTSAIDVLQRTVIKAPVSGTVTGLKYHTHGGVIAPGAHILDIVPIEDDLIIEAKFQTRNIEAILSAQKKDNMMISDGPYKGLKVKVRLSAYSSRKVGLLEGIAIQVSADAFSEQNGMRYYLVRVVIPKTQLSSFNNKIQLYPGMPAEIYIITQSRTLLNYLSSPIISTFNRALRES